MLVRDMTPTYSPLGRYAGRTYRSMGDFDIGALITGIGSAVKDTAAAVVNVVGATKPSDPSVNITQPYVNSAGLYQQPAPALPAKPWYSDPLMLGAAGIAVVGLGAVLLGRRRRGGFAGFAGPSRRRRRIRRSRR